MFYQTQTARKPPSACTAVTPSPPRRRRNGVVFCCMTLFAAYGARLTMHCQRGWLSSFSFFFVPGDLDLWPWHSNSSERGTKHIFPVNLAQIRSAVPEIFYSQTNKKKQKSHRLH